MKKLTVVSLIVMMVSLGWLAHIVISASGITQQCPTNCPSSCTCEGTRCTGTPGSCGGVTVCQCSEPYPCYNTVGCPYSNGRGSCFLPGTLINTKDGLKPIEQIKVGDQVLTLENGKELRYNSVLLTYQATEPGYFVINGTIKVTGSHPFLVNGKWTRVENIKPGDKLLSKDVKPITVESITKVNKPVKVFNFEVENAHNFFAQGILVHNLKPK